MFALKTCIVFSVLFFSFSNYARDIAITIDDHPMPDGPLFSIEQRTAKFAAACEKHACVAAFFCIGKCCKTESETASLNVLGSCGHFLANHSMTHRHLSRMPLVEWETEVRETDLLLTQFPNKKKWFRYPFLDYGNRSDLGGSREKAIAAYQVLEKLGYLEGYVTVNTFDWHINARLQQAIVEGMHIDYVALKQLYLSLLREWCTYYAELYNRLIVEKITHTLLLHANDLNAMYLDDILHMLRDAGWTVVSPENAMHSITWRKKIFEDPNFVITKPSTLDCRVIDDLIQSFHVFEKDAEGNLDRLAC